MAGATGVAQASVTVGQAAPELSSRIGCSEPYDLLQAGSQSGTPSYVVPSDGVVTSFSIRSRLESSTSGYKLKTYSETGPDRYLVKTTSDRVTLDGQGLKTFPTRQAVKAGEVLGMAQDGGGEDCLWGSGSENDVVKGQFSNPDPAPGQELAINAGNIRIRVNIEANLEADADNDGFGDETQDSCPSDASTQGECPVIVNGPLTPFLSDGSSRFKAGTVLEIRVKPTQGGQLITNLSPKVNIVRTGNPSGPQTATVPVLKRAADSGNTARYSAQFGQYQFYAATTKSQFNGGKDLAAGKYRVDVSDPVFPGTAHKVARNFAIVP